MNKDGVCSEDLQEELHGFSHPQKLNKVLICSSPLSSVTPSSSLSSLSIGSALQLTIFPQATVLSKAIEYIGHLEARTKCLAKENYALKGRVEAFEILVMARFNPESAACHGNPSG
jgi:hypothetical protein